MQKPTHATKEPTVKTIAEIENKAKIQIREAIDKQLPLARKKLQSDNVLDEEIEKILLDTAEKQYQLLFSQFKTLFLIELQKIFPSRANRKKSI